MLRIASRETGSPIKVLMDVRKVRCMAMSNASTVASNRMSTCKDGSVIGAPVGTALTAIGVAAVEAFRDEAEGEDGLVLGGSEGSAVGGMLGGDDMSEEGSPDGTIAEAKLEPIGTGGRDANATKVATSTVGSDVLDGTGEGASLGNAVTGCSDGAIDGSRVKGDEGDPERAIGSETIGTGADFGPNDGTLVFLAVGVTVIAFRGTGLGMVVGACLVGASEGVLVTGPTLGVVASGKEGTPDSNICANGGSCSGGGVEIGGCVGCCVMRSSLGIAVADGPMLMADGCSVEAS